MFILTISRPSPNMGYLGSKSRSPGKILGSYVLQSRGHICDLILMKLDQNVYLTISRPISNMAHVWLKTRSPGQTLGNSCLHSRSQISDSILMELNQNVCLDSV